MREPSECAPLKEVLGEWVTPETLIHILRSRGINIFPYADSRKYVANTFKVHKRILHTDRRFLDERMDGGIDARGIDGFI